MRKYWTYMVGAVCLLAVVVVCFFGYNSYLQKKIYEENSKLLTAHSEQVNTSFQFFTQRNWNVLSECDGLLQRATDASDVADIRESFADLKNSWGYKELYLFNQSSQVYTVENRRETINDLVGVFDEMYKTNNETVGSYFLSDGTRRTFFAHPLSSPITLEGVAYTGVAVSYTDEVMSRIVTKDAFEGKSDSYLVRGNGDVVVALEAKTEFETYVQNMFTFLGGKATFLASDVNTIRQDVADKKNGSALINYQGKEFYLTYTTVGISDWVLIGVIEAEVIDTGMQEAATATMLVFIVLAVVIAGFVFFTFANQQRSKLHQKERERKQIAEQKELTDQLFNGIAQIVDRFAVADIVNNKCEYHEKKYGEPLYPNIRTYKQMTDAINARYAVLGKPEAKMSDLLSPEHLRSVLRKDGDCFKIEYFSHDRSIFKILNIVPIEWDKNDRAQKVILIVQDIAQKVELQMAANTDTLTGLYNGRFFSEVLRDKESCGEPFVLFYLDLDYFKPVNDTYGHDMGDKLLKQVAKRLRSCIRSLDYAFRIGGDEFALMVSSDGNEKACQGMIERVTKNLSAPYLIDNHTIRIGVSCGFAAYPKDGDTSQVRITADKRMYEEKAKKHIER